MSSFYSLTKSLKACLFTATVYGWLVPTVWIADQLNEWMPTRQLTNTDWVIESGQQNTSWDLTTVDGTDTIESQDDAFEIQGSESSTQVITKSHRSAVQTSKQNNPSASETEELIAQKSDEGDPNVGSTAPKIAVQQHHLAKGLPSHPTKRFSARTRTARQGKCQVENPDIAKAGKNSYTVPKSTLKHYSTHWKDASRLAHLSWAMKKDGSRLGIRIRGISCKSPLKFTGLRRGDVVLSINDHSVQTEKDLLKVYSRLLFWKKMDVKVKRGSQTVTLKYNIT
jgi:hypothetical protein